ncbi:MAG: hypothetical protein HKN23_07465 [Verrucomicrobiales bacterium]|nr:hypothetical protein [Verrucomicrobiales bacterium]
MSPWFVRRIGLMIALVTGLGLYFFYDGWIGYPKKNFNAALFAAFETGKSGDAGLPDPSAFHLADFSEAQSEALNQAIQSGRKGETWSRFAASRHLAAEEPKILTAKEIRDQFFYGALMGIIAAGLAIYLLRERKKTLSADESGIRFPAGNRLKFAEISQLDLRKWDRGIAFVKAGATRAKIDDYKYTGAGEIVNRLQAENPDLDIVAAEDTES